MHVMEYGVRILDYDFLPLLGTQHVGHVFATDLIDHHRRRRGFEFSRNRFQINEDVRQAAGLIGQKKPSRRDFARPGFLTQGIQRQHLLLRRLALQGDLSRNIRSPSVPSQETQQECSGNSSGSTNHLIDPFFRS